VWAGASSRQVFGKVAILGTGLMGGSLGMALRERRLAREVWGYNRHESTLREAREKGAIDSGSCSLKEVVKEAELVVLAVPVRFCQDLLSSCASYLSPGALVTDLGSTKKYLTEKIPLLLPANTCYLGGHPMTGSEESGIKAADPALWENAIYVLTPSSSTPEFYRKRLHYLVEGIGAQPLVLSPEEHDRLVALVSHLPHLVAVALVKVAAAQGEDEIIRTLAAGGFRDTTRVALGNPEVWRDICITNREAIINSLKRTIEMLEEITHTISESREDYLKGILEEASQYRRSIPYQFRSYLPEIFELVVLVKDTPGVIGRLATILGEKEVNIAEIEILHVREEEGGSIRLGFREEGQRSKALTLLEMQGYRVHRR